MEVMLICLEVKGAGSDAPLPPLHLLIFSLCRFHPSPSPSDVNGSPGNNRAVSLRLHVVVKVHIHFFAGVASVDVIGWRQNVSASGHSSKSVVSLLFFLHAVIEVKLPPLSFIHLTAKKDVVGSRGVAG